MKDYNFRLLAIAREARGLTQAQLVEKVQNLTQGNYSKMEKGILAVPADTLSNIADALKFPLDFFRYSKPIYNQSEYFYRKRATMPRKQQITLEATFDILRIWIEELLSSVEIPEFRIPPIQVRPDNSPEDIARKVRTFLNVPKGPIEKLVNLMERNGIIIFYLNGAPEKFDGTTVVTSSGQHVIVINNDYPNDRKRFTIAHEFFHIISHLPFTNFESDKDAQENEADRFAAEFLMPEFDIRRDLAYFRFSNLGDLKLYWKASKAAIIRRAYTLNYIDKNKFTNMMIELSRNGERKMEHLAVPLDTPKLIKAIVDTHLNELEYTVDDLCKSISISAEDFDRLILGNEYRKLRIAV